MDDLDDLPIPSRLETILAHAEEVGCLRSCYPRLGALLRTLAASTPGGRILELGTGMGPGAAALLDGMDATARLLSVERDAVQDVARAVLGDDPRIAFVAESADTFLERQPTASVDLVFADTGPGKFSLLDHAVRVLRPGVRRPLRGRLAALGRPGGG